MELTTVQKDLLRDVIDASGAHTDASLAPMYPNGAALIEQALEQALIERWANGSLHITAAGYAAFQTA